MFVDIDFVMGEKKNDILRGVCNRKLLEVVHEHLQTDIVGDDWRPRAVRLTVWENNNQTYIQTV